MISCMLSTTYTPIVDWMFLRCLPGSDWLDRSALAARVGGLFVSVYLQPDQSGTKEGPGWVDGPALTASSVH